MKIRLTLALASMLAVMGLTGCTTTSTGQKVPDAALMKATAQEAALIGTTLYLKDHPEQRPTFVTVRASVKALLDAGNFDAAALTASLQALPIKELQGNDGILIVGAAVTLWDAYGKQLAALDKNQVGVLYVLPVIQGVYDGLNAALGP
jgi:hypothetical protein